MRKVFKLRLWGGRLGPTDVLHPLLTSVHSPFNLLRSFKDDVRRSKMDFIIVLGVSPFPCTKNTLITVCLYLPSAHSVLLVCMVRKKAAYVSYKPLNNGNNQLKVVCAFFIHGNVQLTWVSDMHA